MKKISKIIFILSAIVFLAAGCSERLFGTPRDGTTTKIYDQSKQKLDTVNEQIKQRIDENLIAVSEIVEGSNLNKADGYKVEAGKNALDLLKTTHQTITKEYSGIGEFVESIDGIKPDNKHFWAFYVNGASSNVGASAYVLKNNDKIEWKLEEIK